MGSTQTQTTAVVQHAPWSPAQLLALVGGLALVVIGGIALARTGTDFSNIPATRATVAGLHFTCLSALIQLVVGVILLAGAAGPSAAKSLSAATGVALLAWGIVIVADVPLLANMWGYTASTGVFYIVLGVVLLVGGAMSPIIYARRRRVATGGGRYVDSFPRG